MVGHHAVGVGVPVVFIENLLDCLHQGLRPGDVMHLLDPGDCLKEVGVHLIAEGAETALPIDGFVVVDLSGKVFDHGSVVWNSFSVSDQGALPPPESLRSHKDCGEAVTLADVIHIKMPLAALAADRVDLCPELPIALQIHHHGVDGALVALGVHTHAANDLRAGLGTVVQQGGTDSDADEGVEHGSVVVNKGNLQDEMGGCDPSRNNHSQSRMMDQNEPLP